MLRGLFARLERRARRILRWGKKYVNNWRPLMRDRIEDSCPFRLADATRICRWYSQNDAKRFDTISGVGTSLDKTNNFFFVGESLVVEILFCQSDVSGRYFCDVWVKHKLPYYEGNPRWFLRPQTKVLDGGIVDAMLNLRRRLDKRSHVAEQALWQRIPRRTSLGNPVQFLL